MPLGITYVSVASVFNVNKCIPVVFNAISKSFCVVTVISEGFILGFGDISGLVSGFVTGDAAGVASVSNDGCVVGSITGFVVGFVSDFFLTVTLHFKLYVLAFNVFVFGALTLQVIVALPFFIPCTPPFFVTFATLFF